MPPRAPASTSSPPRPLRARARLLLAGCLLLGLPSALLSAQPVAVLAPRLSAPAALRQGDPLLASLWSEAPLGEARVALLAPSGKVITRALAFPAGRAAPAGTAYALLAIPLDLPPGAYTLRAEGSLGPAVAGAPAAAFSRSLTIGVTARAFPVEDIPLDAANTALRTVPDPQKTAEAERLYALLGRVDPGATYLGGAFSLPLVGARRSAGFGDIRRYLYYANGTSEGAIHAGIDFAVPVGTPVGACGAGRVVFSGMRIVTGYTVILEHLPGLYSIYMHLSALKVAEGQVLAPGDLLGLSGKTGLATGPHLHWELRLRGDPVDPEAWVGSSPLDKE